MRCVLGWFSPIVNWNCCSFKPNAIRTQSPVMHLGASTTGWVRRAIFHVFRHLGLIKQNSLWEGLLYRPCLSRSHKLGLFLRFTMHKIQFRSQHSPRLPSCEIGEGTGRKWKSQGKNGIGEQEMGVAFPFDTLISIHFVQSYFVQIRAEVFTSEFNDLWTPNSYYRPL